MDAIGIIEVTYLANSIFILDKILKGSDVDLLRVYTRLGGKMVHYVIEGTVSSVENAIAVSKENSTHIGEKNLKTAVMISNPHQEVIDYLMAR